MSDAPLSIDNRLINEVFDYVLYVLYVLAINSEFQFQVIPARGPQTKLKCNPDLQAIEFPQNCSCLVGCQVNLPGGGATHAK